MSSSRGRQAQHLLPGPGPSTHRKVHAIKHPDSARFLAAYDSQLRLAPEVAGARSVLPLGPLRLATFDGGRGFVTYAGLGGASAATVAE